MLPEGGERQLQVRMPDGKKLTRLLRITSPLQVSCHEVTQTASGYGMSM